MKINDIFLEKVLDKIIEHNAIPILVGGCVRDSFLNLEVKDYDVEVYGLNTLEELEEMLEEFGSVNLVGKSFGIVKLSTATMEYDFSFPRLENKIADGHTGFDVVINGHLDFKEATKRRDFTINSIGYDYKNKNYLDPFYGIKDIEKKLLRHIDDDTFIEDPLRVY
ncbi:MAG: tRNA nucleotidyltransferase (CCA-adding enzyme), partial [Arcobacteraceae bacterium]